MPPTVEELHPTRPQTGKEEFESKLHPDMVYLVAYLSEAAQDEGPPTGEGRYMVVSTKQRGMIGLLKDPPPVPVPPPPVPVGREDGLGAVVTFDAGGETPP